MTHAESPTRWKFTVISAIDTENTATPKEPKLRKLKKTLQCHTVQVMQ